MELRMDNRVFRDLATVGHFASKNRNAISFVRLFAEANSERVTATGTDTFRFASVTRQLRLKVMEDVELFIKADEFLNMAEYLDELSDWDGLDVIDGPEGVFVTGEYFGTLHSTYFGFAWPTEAISKIYVGTDGIEQSGPLGINLDYLIDTRKLAGMEDGKAVISRSDGRTKSFAIKSNDRNTTVLFMPTQP